MIRRLCILTLLLSAIALAQPPEGGPGGGHGFGGHDHHFGPKPDGGFHPLLPPGRWWKNAEVAKAIDLNDGQVQKIEQIFLDSRMKLVDIHANLQKEEIKLEPLLDADAPDENAVLGAIDRITTARAALEKANAQMAFSIRRVLTPEQWKKLRALRPPHDHFPPPDGRPRIQRDAHQHHHPGHGAPGASGSASSGSGSAAPPPPPHPTN